MAVIRSKIPKYAELVFRGKLWDVYQWKEKMYDGSVGTFEGLRKRSGVKVLALIGNKLVISKEHRPSEKKAFYTLLGGTLEENEEPLEGAKRELLEEAGLKSGKWKLIEVVDVLKYPHVEFYVYIFLASDCIKISEQKLDAGEKIKTEVVTFEDFVEKMKTSSERFGSASELLQSSEKLRAFRDKLGL